jgi:L-serine kinase (ADP)
MIRKHLYGKYKLTYTNELFPHEEVNETRVKEIIDSMTQNDLFTKPIIVDRMTKLIIDGHHRYNAAISIGLKRVPTFEVNYLQTRLKAFKEDTNNHLISKNHIIKTAQSRKLLKTKATCHVFYKSKKSCLSIEAATPQMKPISLKNLI